MMSDELQEQRMMIADYVESCGEIVTAQGPDQIVTAEQLRAYIASALRLVADKIRAGAPFVAALAILAGCAGETSVPPDAYESRFVPCVAPWADAVYDDANARYQVLAVLHHEDGSESYQHPAFDGLRAVATCQDGDVVEFRR